MKITINSFYIKIKYYKGFNKNYILLLYIYIIYTHFMKSNWIIQFSKSSYVDYVINKKFI